MWSGDRGTLSRRSSPMAHAECLVRVPRSPFRQDLWLRAEAVSLAEEAEVDDEEDCGGRRQRQQREGDAYFGVADEAVADEVDHVVDRVEVGQRLVGLGEQRRRVEDAAEEDQRGEDEGLGEGDVVELFGADADQDPELAEEEADEEERGDKDEDVVNREVDEEDRDDE